MQCLQDLNIPCHSTWCFICCLMSFVVFLIESCLANLYVSQPLIFGALVYPWSSWGFLDQMAMRRQMFQPSHLGFSVVLPCGNPRVPRPRTRDLAKRCRNPTPQSARDHPVDGPVQFNRQTRIGQTWRHEVRGISGQCTRNPQKQVHERLLSNEDPGVFVL